MIPTVTRPALSPGRKCPSKSWTSSSKRCATHVRSALLNGWAQSAGEANRLHRQPAAPVPPPGRPLLRSAQSSSSMGPSPICSTDRPQLKTLMLHNIDTLGADVDPALLGAPPPKRRKPGLTFEVITRRLEDRGGGLASVEGRPRASSRASRCRARRTSS